MVVVFLAEGFEEVEALAPVDVMRRAGLAVKLAGVTGREVTGSHGICVQTDVDAQDVDATLLEAMVLPGGLPGTHNLEASPAVQRCIDSCVAQGKLVAAICAAPSILAHKGLLAGKNATAFPQLPEGFTGGRRPSQRKLCGAGRPVPHRPGHGRCHPVRPGFGGGPCLPGEGRGHPGLHPVGGVKKEKAALRRELLARRDALPGRAEKSRAIQSRVLALPEYQRARRVLLYLSKGSEVDTWPLLDRALAQGKEVYAPRCLERPGEMAFYRVSSREDLQAGAFGLLEPIPGRCPPLERGQGDLCLVPGLAFDREGYRLGYGKGYYDCFLAAQPVRTVGLCFEALAFERLPRDGFDRPVCRLVTEAGDARPGKEGFL